MMIITEKRHDLILEQLGQKDFLTLQELIDRTGCSASTIRRDLSKLQEQGKLQRVHGGAMLTSNRMVEANLTDKMATNLEEKESIAKIAAQQVKDNDCIFIDAGSTTLEMIKHIKAKNVIAVTNGLTHVQVLLQQGIKTLMLGGQIKDNTLATVGSSAVETLRRYRFDKAFLGMNGLDMSFGLTTPDEQEALVKQTAIQLANQSFILIDHSKFNKVFFARVSINDQTVIITSDKALNNKDSAEFLHKYSFIGGSYDLHSNV
ncbi:DeoR/GlpR transcriptional regulator [Staphylococcus simiae]|uniref:DeoR/GlpR family DNA-binding transcription regulator n=1 Tax=Staphylococcus simiae TaxID=308354 RepID=UPI001A956968|nr:DeoR/GlpR family DNA-binding transcription regulator [Staphylococcus simiae]MBO1199918.1 DeoR/GlpR transcriptional regulator [Staphylococcus simiae]MBO1202194.1 DeoR/GlpR transcriptional regulator [Staphylococcus simiae]MBO1204450.1 DeoR/GlpR transcriptional regulator [Staphylococcus simiae]MBO1211992.1 DeoR/GlpR transcriptional regulator [Staphylococcus simiae]MBO1230635.1 DeoR/GlpR transcriptional regulator [Staphylococcus simiae]